MATRFFSDVLQGVGNPPLVAAANGESIVFTRTASYIATGGSVLRAARSASVTVDGALYAEQAAIAALKPGALKVRVGETGSVFSSAAEAVISRGTTLDLVNRGDVSGVTGVYSTAVTTITNHGAIDGATAINVIGARATIVNTGKIAGDALGIVLLDASGGQSITNTGTISAGANAAILVTAAGAIEIVNSGTITGRVGVQFGALAASDVEERRIVNDGHIGGSLAAIYGGIAADVVVNRGTIAGQVALAGGDDLFDGSAGAQTGWVRGQDGDDVLIGSASGRSNLDGGTGADALYGGAADDLLLGGLGVDELNGGMGIDVASYRDRSDRIYYNAALGITPDDDVFISIEGVEGGSGNDSLNGGLQDDVLIGGAGNDQLFGGDGGRNRLVGGLGDDSYYQPNDGDKIIERPNEGYDIVYADSSYTLAANVEELRLISPSGPLSGTGNDLANVIAGSGADNYIDGRLGNDRLTGGAGSDTFAFSTAPSAGNVDIITDFDPATDGLRFTRSVFSALPDGIGGSGTQLPSSAFWAGTAAHDADDRLIFDAAARSLYYDPDGTGAAAKILVVTFTTDVALTASDISMTF